MSIRCKRYLFSKFAFTLSAMLVLAGPVHAAQFCYLPSESNVPYSDVISLPTGKPTATFAYGLDPNQHAELWLPQSSSTSASFPVVVFIHGGCWLAAYDIKHSWALATSLANSGYAVWSIEYRRTGHQGGGWPGSFQDVLSAIKFLLQSGSSTLRSYPIDLQRIAIAGHSAGGHLALLAGSDIGLSQLDVAQMPEVVGVYGLAAISDIETYSQGENSCQSATSKFMNGRMQDKPQDYRKANPIYRTLHPNTLLLHGEADSIVPVSQAHVKSAKKNLISDAGHFDHIHPGTVAHKRLLQRLASAFR